MTEEDGKNNRGLALTKAVNGGDTKVLPLWNEAALPESVCEFVYLLSLNDEHNWWVNNKIIGSSKDQTELQDVVSESVLFVSTSIWRNSSMFARLQEVFLTQYSWTVSLKPDCDSVAVQTPRRGEALEFLWHLQGLTAPLLLILHECSRMASDGRQSKTLGEMDRHDEVFIGQQSVPFPILSGPNP